jgi:site-specific DNA-methyltransferase (adenine-specific)
LYQCDNLELLSQLPENYIDLIYCDILYNTGKKFTDYDDRLGTPEEAMKWYKPRLIEIYRTLKETGSIYLQCDYRLVHYLKVEMDKIFGYDNFQNHIIWCYNGGGTSKNKFSRKHDDILFYTKTDKYTFNIQYQPYKETTAKRFKNIHKGSDKQEDLLRGTPMTDWWIDVSLIANPVNKEYTGYNTQKPKALLERIIKASSNEGDIVADFFMGSCTTGEVALELGRRFIGCDIGDKACEISKNRIQHMVNKAS